MFNNIYFAPFVDMDNLTDSQKELLLKTGDFS